MFVQDRNELSPRSRGDGYRFKTSNRSYRPFLKRSPGFYGNVLIKIDPVALQDFAGRISRFLQLVSYQVASGVLWPAAGIAPFR
jgi:hypothetical protein